MVSLISAALSLSLMVTAAPPRAPAVRNAAFVMSAAGDTVAKRSAHKAPPTRRASAARATSARASGPQASASGCYEVTANFTLIPCGHPH